jgi:hypothetical protein
MSCLSDPVLGGAGKSSLPLPVDDAQLGQGPRVEAHRALGWSPGRLPQLQQGHRFPLERLQDLDVQGRRQEGKGESTGARHLA